MERKEKAAGEAQPKKGLKAKTEISQGKNKCRPRFLFGLLRAAGRVVFSSLFTEENSYSEL